MSYDSPNPAPHARVELESRKLALEIKELGEAPNRARRTARLQTLTACLSAATAILVALVSAYAGYQLQRFGDRPVYSKLLTDLDSPFPSPRSGAAAGLADLILEDAGKTNQTIAILLAKIQSETDGTVIKSLIDALVRIGRPAVDEVARANRSARAAYRESSAEYILFKMPSLASYSSIPESERFLHFNEDIEKISLPITEAIGSLTSSGIFSPSEEKLIGIKRYFNFNEGMTGETDNQTFRDIFLKLNSIERYEIRHYFDLYKYLLFIQTTRSRVEEDYIKLIDNSLLKAISAERIICMTSIIINRILHNTFDTFDGISLRDVAL
jgi:hypothetical protein